MDFGALAGFRILKEVLGWKGVASAMHYTGFWV